MNFLAHLYLAGDSPDERIGALLADFVRGALWARRLEGFNEATRRAIQLHRRVDAFTDAHPVVRASKRRIDPAHRRYAGILVDLFYDHFLARGWADYSPVPLDTFAAGVYDLLEAERSVLPPPLAAVAARMAAEDWLGSYVAEDGIRAAAARIARRLRRPHPLEEAVDELAANYRPLAEDFARFFPEVTGFVQACR